MTPLIDFQNGDAISESQPTSGRWLRDSTGTYEIQYDKKGDRLNRIANQHVRIIQILFVIVGGQINIEYLVEFADAFNNVKVRISHEDLSDASARIPSEQPLGTPKQDHRHQHIDDQSRPFRHVGLAERINQPDQQRRPERPGDGAEPADHHDHE